MSEYLCRREETWQVMSNKLLKSISSFRDTIIFQRIIYTVSRWKVPGAITWIPAYQRSARHGSWSGCAWLQAWWQTLVNYHRTNSKKANWHKCITWRCTSHCLLFYIQNAWRAPRVGTVGTESEYVTAVYVISVHDYWWGQRTRLCHYSMIKVATEFLWYFIRSIDNTKCYCLKTRQIACIFNSTNECT